MTIYATTTSALRQATVKTGTGDFNLYCKDQNSCTDLDATIASTLNVNIECNKGGYSCVGANLNAPKSTNFMIECAGDYGCSATSFV